MFDFPFESSHWYCGGCLYGSHSNSQEQHCNIYNCGKTNDSTFVCLLDDLPNSELLRLATFAERL